ncbi:hypothetical protein KKH27_08135 [bacterium]|nr:hypothetical protein [bacterium]MBU1983000.1 hypothetical protein [bacterium]
MPRPKTGNEAKVVGVQINQKIIPEHRGPGRNHAPEKYTKATVPLFDRQIAALDEIRAAIKRETGASVMRAEIIRAALDTVLEAKIDLTSVRPEPEFKNGDLKRLISSRLKPKP